MLLKPKIKLEKVTDITTEILQKYNIDSLILDVDNTLSTHHGDVLTDGLEDWLETMHKNGIKLMVLSRRIGVKSRVLTPTKLPPKTSVKIWSPTIAVFFLLLPSALSALI